MRDETNDCTPLAVDVRTLGDHSCSAEATYTGSIPEGEITAV
jgi:hypothetical protein